MSVLQNLLGLKIIGIDVVIHSDDSNLLSQFRNLYSAFEVSPVTNAVLQYDLVGSLNAPKFRLTRRQPAHVMTADDEGMLFFRFEKDATIEIQKQRKDLYFLHSAALEKQGRAILIIASSGTGKSTLSWALTLNGYRYLSDELAPLELTTLSVIPYPHALCLKADPPEGYSLPVETVRTTRTLHVPTASIEEVGEPDKEVSVAGIFFLSRDPELSSSRYTELSPAEAGMRLYANGLNQLAHEHSGLPAAVSIASQVPCYSLETGPLASTIALLDEFVAGC